MKGKICGAWDMQGREKNAFRFLKERDSSKDLDVDENKSYCKRCWKNEIVGRGLESYGSGQGPVYRIWTVWIHNMQSMSWITKPEGLRCNPSPYLSSHQKESPRTGGNFSDTSVMQWSMPTRLSTHLALLVVQTNARFGTRPTHGPSYKYRQQWSRPCAEMSG